MNTEYATPAELNSILGDHWAICRNTENNRARYGRCITKNQYARATAQALNARAANVRTAI